jgi:hypothetical protein
MLDLRTVVSILSKIFSAFPPTPFKPSFDWECKGKGLYSNRKNFSIFFKKFFLKKLDAIFRRTVRFLKRDAKVGGFTSPTKYFCFFLDNFSRGLFADRLLSRVYISSSCFITN